MLNIGTSCKYMTVSLFRVHGWPTKRGMDKDKKCKGLHNLSLSCRKDRNIVVWNDQPCPANTLKANILDIGLPWYWTETFQAGLKPPTLFFIFLVPPTWLILHVYEKPDNLQVSVPIPVPPLFPASQPAAAKVPCPSASSQSLRRGFNPTADTPATSEERANLT